MRIGYNTNGMSQHDLFEGLKLLAETGYQSVAINVDHGFLCATDTNVDSNVQKVRASLIEYGMSSVVEAKANFLLDPKIKNAPTLMDQDPNGVEGRMRYLKYCIDVAAELGSDCMSMRSGIKPQQLTFETAMTRLVDGLTEVMLYAAERNVVVSVEPEPGMLVDTLGRFERLLHLFDSPRLMLTLDVGHLFCNGELPLANQLDRWADKICNVHIEDVRSGIHQHLPFGEGDIGFPLVLNALAKSGFEGGVHVDLCDHSHVAAEMIQRSYHFLSPLLANAKAKRFEI